MADDTEIEEHNIDDNPRIKNTFPDLTTVKIEVTDCKIEDRRMQIDMRMVDRIIYEDNPEISNSQLNQDNIENERFYNDYEFDDNTQVNEESKEQFCEEIERHGYCIILGSKPNRSVPKKELHVIDSPNIVLEDWGPRLQRSNCYCKYCKILFPTRNSLETHNIATHSIINALRKDPESPYKSLPVESRVPVNIAMKSIEKNISFLTKSSLSDPSTSTDTYYNDCNKKTELIRHFESHLTDYEDENSNESNNASVSKKSNISTVSQGVTNDTNIQMSIMQHGPPEDTVYKCSCCDGYLTASMVRAQFDKSNCCPPRYRCKLCHLDFSMNVCLEEHETVCGTSQKKHRKVTFNGKNDISFNRDLQVTQVSQESLTDLREIKTRESIYRLYECEICMCCLILRSNIKNHKCSKSSERVKCQQCGLFFKKKHMYRHRHLHKKLPKLSKSTVTTIPFKPETFKLLPKLYKCQCRLHFTSLQTAEKNFTLCEPKNQIYEENCSKCGLLFPISVLVSHLCRHHSNEKESEFDMQHVMTLKKKYHGSTGGVQRKTNSKVTIHKCAQCDVCFISHRSLERHFKDNHRLLSVLEHCDQCNVNFTKHSITQHTQLHHTLPKYSRSNLTIKVYYKDANQLTTKSVKPDTIDSQNKTKPRKDRKIYNRCLYQCQNCKIHFLTNVACHVHYKKYHEESPNTEKKSKNCHVCGLAFTPSSLARHVKIHHKMMRLNRKDFNIVKKVFKLKETQQLEKLKMNESSTIYEDEGKFQGVNDLIVTNRLYRCRTCSVHFCKESQLIDHVSVASVSGHNHTATVCQYCQLKFTSGTGIELHINEHHEKLKLSHKEFIIIENHNVEGAYASRYLYKCSECVTHFVKESNAEQHDHASDKSKCRACGLLFSSVELEDHTNVHHELMEISHYDLGSITLDIKRKSYHSKSECSPHMKPRSQTQNEIEHHLENTLKANNIKHCSGAARKRKSQDNTDTENMLSIKKRETIKESGKFTEKPGESNKGDVNQSEISSLRTDKLLKNLNFNKSKSSITDSSKSQPEKVPIKLYKCGDCNVFYITQNTCYKHMLNHEKLDFKEYVQCKFCCLQFRNVTLHKHVMKHHKAGLDLEIVLIEEYLSVKDKIPKIKIYYALNKIRSRLANTETKSKKVCEEKVDNALEDVVNPYDDQELIIKETIYKSEVNGLTRNNSIKTTNIPTVEENISKTNINHTREQFVLKSAVKAIIDPMRDEILSKPTFKDDGVPSVNQVVSTNKQNYKDNSDSAVHKTVTEINAKNKMDHVKQMVISSTVEHIGNRSTTQTDTNSDVKHFTVPTIDLTKDDEHDKNKAQGLKCDSDGLPFVDQSVSTSNQSLKYITGSAVYKTVSEIKVRDNMTQVVNQMMTSINLEDISDIFAKQAKTDSDGRHFIVPTVDLTEDDEHDNYKLKV